MAMLVRRVSIGYTASAAVAPDRHPAATRSPFVSETALLPPARARASGSIRSLLTVSYTCLAGHQAASKTRWLHQFVNVAVERASKSIRSRQVLALGLVRLGSQASEQSEKITWRKLYNGTLH